MTEGRSKRVAIVTGAARRLGAAVATELHRRGCDVMIHCRASAKEADRLAASLNDARPGSAATVAADLEDASAADLIVEAALEDFGRIDVLVNNASTFYPTPLEKASPQDWDVLMASNQKAPFWLSLAAARRMRDDGAIVNLVDIHGMVPLAAHAIYSQAKAGLIMQTMALARELAPDVRVNAVAPGSILWPENEAAGDQAMRDILERVPMKRQGTPADIAGAVAFLALDAPYVTGQVLAVDGGRLLNM